MKKTELSSDQVRRGIEWLKHKNLADVKDVPHAIHFTLGPKGEESAKDGLPEIRLVNAIKNGTNNFHDLEKILKDDFQAAISNAKKNGWIDIKKIDSNLSVSLIGDNFESEEQKLLQFLYDGTITKKDPNFKIFKDAYLRLKYRSHFEDENPPDEKPSIEMQRWIDLYDNFNRPKYINDEVEIRKKIALTIKGEEIVIDEKISGAIDVEANVPVTYVARIHPLKETINEIREIFVSLGFSEVLGNLAQPSFWNFDALFTPQDHPAREMQDTFYLKDMKASKFATSAQINQVSRSHKKGWRYDWNMTEAQRMALRTHTTCVTIKYLADNKPDESRIFSLGRVFRNEKVSYKHLAEFNQVEGVVIGKSVTLRDLMGLQEEFYRRIGLTKIKFWPTFFPYTEPSLQSMVYNDRLGKWIELFGMGIFRPEVTKPLGITKPVLAWGGGIERIAMLKYGLDDVREFYNNNLNWLRSATKCQ